MIGYGVIKAIGEVGRHRGGRSWMLRVGLIAVKDVGWADRGRRRFRSLLMCWLGVEITIHY